MAALPPAEGEDWSAAMQVDRMVSANVPAVLELEDDLRQLFVHLHEMADSDVVGEAEIRDVISLMQVYMARLGG
jgi:hypothetical protein